MDHPGFGLSEGLHGYIPSFDELADNVIENYRKIKGVTSYVLTITQHIIIIILCLKKDVADFISNLRMAGRPELKGLPCFILGQSMGGAVTLKVHFKEPHEWEGVILVAPMCKVSYSLFLL